MPYDSPAWIDALANAIITIVEFVLSIMPVATIYEACAACCAVLVVFIGNFHV